MLTRLWLWLLTALGLDPRGIYVFHDGRRWRRVDPLATFLRLYDVPGFDPDTVQAELAACTDPIDRLRKVAKIAAAVRSAFDVLPVAGGGLTEVECVELLANFIQYAEDLKKNIEPTPNWDPSTESLPLGISPTEAASLFGGSLGGPAPSKENPSDSES